MISSDNRIQTLSASLQSFGATKVYIEIDLKTASLSAYTSPALICSEEIRVLDLLWPFLRKLLDKDSWPGYYQYTASLPGEKLAFQLSLPQTSEQNSPLYSNLYDRIAQENVSSPPPQKNSSPLSTKDGNLSQTDAFSITALEDSINLLSYVWLSLPLDVQQKFLSKTFEMLTQFLLTLKNFSEKQSESSEKPKTPM